MEKISFLQPLLSNPIISKDFDRCSSAWIWQDLKNLSWYTGYEQCLQTLMISILTNSLNNHFWPFQSFVYPSRSLLSIQIGSPLAQNTRNPVTINCLFIHFYLSISALENPANLVIEISRQHLFPLLSSNRPTIIKMGLKSRWLSGTSVNPLYPQALVLIQMKDLYDNHKAFLQGC